MLILELSNACWKWNSDSARRVHFGDDAMTNIFNVDMNNELQSVCHEAFLAHLEKQVTIVVVTSTNVDTIMKDFIDKHNVDWETTFIEMYKSKTLSIR